MTIINEFIYFNVSSVNEIDKSFCISKKDDIYLYLTYGLFSKDCLFDLSDTNYLIDIRISKTYFEKYSENFEIVIEHQNICCNTQTKLLDLINCKLSGIHRKIFLESIILFLLYQTQKNSLIFQLDCNSCSILNKPTNLEKMKIAKNFIIDNIGNNLTIPIIAGHVGTNQCYLKKGFKDAFNQTIFEFIQENRMVKAKFLLQNANQNISEIAFDVGYASLSSFSQAYKNYFGITPLEHLKVTIPDN